MTKRRLWMATAAAAGWAVAVAGAAQAQQPAQVQEVVVTGSRLAGGDRVTPVETVNRTVMAAAGVGDAGQLTRLVTANSGSEAQVDQLNQPQSSGTAQFNLRNLGLGSTLVLVDGQRWTSSAVVATDGAAFVDINALVPLIALERIEVVNPVIVVLEWNSVFGPDHPVSVPYDPAFSRAEAHYSCLYWGASMGAFESLGSAKGYSLLGSNRVGNNIFFVRKSF